MKKNFVARLTVLLVLSHFVFYSCNDSAKKNSSNGKDTTTLNQIDEATIAGNFSGQTSLKFDSTALQPFFTAHPSFNNYKEEIQRFYSGRGFTYAWFDANGQIEQAGNLYNRIQNLEQEGIRQNPLYLAKIDSVLTNSDSADISSRTTAELMFTALYFSIAERVWGGIEEKKFKENDWYLPRKKINYSQWLDSILAGPDLFSRTPEPLYRQYHLLKAALKKYDSLKSDVWTPIVPLQKSYRFGDTASVLSDIRNKLRMLEDIGVSGTGNLFDSSLLAAVKSFQRRFGMKDDGVIGQQMLSALNVAPSKRIEQIIVNMERSRWLPESLEGDYLAINIPEFKLHAYHGDSLLFDMNVVVGKAVNKTVIFSGDLKYVVFSPYWNVPASILKNEVLPGIKRNPGYLARNHMEWNGNSVRQKPGPWNSLGEVKFLFPNSFSIYLHDTPSKNLFKEDKRAFSHGCIRVAEPKKLAMHLFRNDSTWTDAKVTTAMKSGKEMYVTLKKTVPVYIAYFTVWVDRQGKLNFRDDIYSRDTRLAEMLGAAAISN